MTATCELPNEAGTTCSRRATHVVFLFTYPIAACARCARQARTEIIALKISHRVPLSWEERRERIRLMARRWDESNIEKRRQSSRCSKRRLRLLKNYERDPDRPRFLSLDAPRCSTNKHQATLHNIIPSAEPNPLEVLIAQEAYENY